MNVRSNRLVKRPLMPLTQQSVGDAAPIYGVRIPHGYREWTLISLARVGAPVNDMRAKLGNDVAIRA